MTPPDSVGVARADPADTPASRAAAGAQAPSAVAGETTPPAPARRRIPAHAAPTAPVVAESPSFATSFQAVPRIPLYLLAGSREEQLARIDAHLDWGRRAIEADRADVENTRRASDDRESRRTLRDRYDARKANYESWRRQLLELRKKADRAS